jgi:hypothetical protein
VNVTDGGNPRTPFQEAVSIITIAAIFVGVGCYAAAVNNVPVLAPMLYWVATEVYHLFPALKALPVPGPDACERGVGRNSVFLSHNSTG